jgi:hypothetical protein
MSIDVIDEKEFNEEDSKYFDIPKKTEVHH